MNRVVQFLFLVAFIGLSSTGYAQTKPVAKKAKTIELTSKLDRLYIFDKPTNQSNIKQRTIFEVDKLPIFCKIEHKLAKSSNVNVMMRLGSLDYVNKLEGKN